MKIDRIFRPFHLWEDYINGMWRRESKQYEDENLIKVIEFTGDHFKYGAAMLRVINEWPYSCEHNLSNININRKAWIGHAACCLENGWPEYIVRRAWWNLIDSQRNLADIQADRAIKLWEQNQRLKIISKHGNKDAIQMAFLIQHQ